MRVISKFSDFYDCGIAYGVDPKLVYERKTQHLEDCDPKRMDRLTAAVPIRISSSYFPSKREDIRECIVTPCWLSFCGKRYFFKRLAAQTTDHKIIYHWIWNQEELYSLHNKYQTRHSWYQRRKNNNTYPVVDDNTQNIAHNSPAVLEILDRQCITVTVDPCLKEIGFSKMMDPYTAFQEISMFLAGPLTPWEDPDLKPEPDGAQKMSNHGMDPVHGFRRN